MFVNYKSEQRYGGYTDYCEFISYLLQVFSNAISGMRIPRMNETKDAYCFQFKLSPSLYRPTP